MAFAINMRQKEFDRFSTIKPVFEIYNSTETGFDLINHGGVAFFSGCENKGATSKIDKLPIRYSALSSKEKDFLEFSFNEAPENNELLTCWFRDVDLNWYKVEFAYRGLVKRYFINDVPKVLRFMDVRYTMSRKSLDNIVSWLFPKNWFDFDISIPTPTEQCNFLPTIENIQQCIDKAKAQDKE